MVVHSPDKFEVQCAAAAAAATTAAAPPSVAAAGHAATAGNAVAAPEPDAGAAGVDGDLLGDNTKVHDFAAWSGEASSSSTSGRGPCWNRWR